MKAKPVILSGGSGVRLWPISRKNLAKQFVDIFQNDSSLFLETVKRISKSPFTPPLIISNISQRFEILKLLKKFKIKTDKIVLEALQKNTAPACAIASYYSDYEEVLCIMPSDHYIEDNRKFLKTLEKASMSIHLRFPDKELYIHINIFMSFIFRNMWDLFSDPLWLSASISPVFTTKHLLKKHACV